MESSTPDTGPRPDSSPTETVTDAITGDGVVSLQIVGETTGQTCGYSMLIQGEVQGSSILSTIDPNETVMILENDTKLLTGSVAGETAGFVLEGSVLAVEFDEPAPSLKIDGVFVDPENWPTVKERTGHGPGQEPVEDPFPDSEALGATPGDPLDPEEYVIELDASGLDAPDAFCFDVDGEIVEYSDDVTISDGENRAYGCLSPGSSAAIAVRGYVTRIDTAAGIDFTVRVR